MGLFKKNDEPYSVDDFLKETMLLSVFFPTPLLPIAAGAYAAKKTVEGALTLNKRRRKKAKERKVLRQTKRSRRRRKIVKQPKPLTKRQMALQAKEQLIERLKIIDEMMMDDDGKRAIKKELYREYQWQIKNIIR